MLYVGITRIGVLVCTRALGHSGFFKRNNLNSNLYLELLFLFRF